MGKVKKIIVALLLSIVTAFCFTGCTDDEIKVRGKFYVLEVAYENGWLDEDDLKSIACGYYDFFQFDKYSDYENLYSGLFDSHEELNERDEKEIKQAYLERIDHAQESIDGVEISQYYGIYNGNIVVGIICGYICYDIITEERFEIGGVVFYNFWQGDILVYHI
mgnify:CR=1 FL=1